MKTHILFNPLANNGRGQEAAEKLVAEKFQDREIALYNVTEVSDLAALINDIPTDDTVVLLGGDGTLHRFANAVYGKPLTHKLLLYPSGSGNDFAHDIKDWKEGEFIELNKYLEYLPSVTVNGETRHFINNVGFGIDGYCCEVGDELRAKSDKPINYTSIAIKGLLGGYKPRNATVCVDGVKKEYKAVWLAPSMNGRFCGGGMMLAPMQDRLNAEHTVSMMVMAKKNKFAALMVFPKVFTGEHVKRTDMIFTVKAHEVSVEFDKPCALQIDGETFLGVTSYTVKA